MCDETIINILKEYRINHDEVVLKGKYSIDVLIDAFEGNCVFIPVLYVNDNHFNNQIISNQIGMI